MIDWSVTNLPLPSALSVTNRSAALRNKAESGRYLQRRRFTTSYEEGTIQFKFLKEQFQIFKGVWVHYLENGTEPFTIDLPVGGNTTLTNCEVKFVNDYTYQYVSVDYVTVQCKIEFKEVTAPDKLALDNLINVGDIYLQREVDTIEMTWTNLDGSASTWGIRPSFQANSGSFVSQKWDGTTTIGSWSSSNKLPATVSEEYFVTHHYPCLSTSDITPNPSGILEYFSIFGSSSGAPYLKYFDWNATNHYFQTLDFVGITGWVPPLPNGEAKIIVKSNFKRVRFTNANLLEKVTFEIEQDGAFERSNIYPIDISSNPILTEIAFTAPAGYQAPINKIRINDNNLLQTLNMENLAQMLPYSTPDQIAISSNDVLSEITFRGTTTPYKVSYSLSYNNLDTITIIDGYLWMYGLSSYYPLSFQHNNFTVQNLKSFVDDLKGHPDGTPLQNAIRMDGNPCWLSGEFNPKAFDSPNTITGITSTATDFEVTTSSNHGLVANQWIKIEGSSVAHYNQLWQVSTSTASNTFTVSDTSNAGIASGGTVKTEADADAFYVEVTGWQNNLSFTT